MPPSEITAISVVPPPTSITMLPIGSWIGSAWPDRRGHRLFEQMRLRSPPGARPSSTARFSTRVMADGTQISTRAMESGDAARWNNSRMIRWVMSKSVIAPPRSGRTATM